MRVSVLQRLRWAQWTGPGGDDSTWTPFVLTEPVPDDEYWRVLAASITDPKGLSNQSAYLFAVPAPLAQFYSGQNTKLFLLTDKPPYAPSNHDGLPQGAGVMFGQGGVKFNNNELQMPSSSGISINSCSMFLGMNPRGIRRMTLAPGWGLLAVQDINGGGGVVHGLVLSIAYIPFKKDECPNAADGPQTFASSGRRQGFIV